MAVESATYIDELTPASIGNTTDWVEGGAQVGMVKQVLVNSFGNVSGAVTATDVEMNYLDITTLGTAENSKVLTMSATGTWTVAGKTCADLGTITTCVINGGTLSGVTLNGAIGGTTPAAGAFTTLTASGAITFTSGTINGVTVGATTPASGAFTTLTASGAVTFTSGTINGIVIGGTTPAAATVTALTANTSFVLNGSTALTSVDTDLTTVSAAHDSLTTAKAVKDHVDSRTETIVIAGVFADGGTGETVYVVSPITGTVTRFDTVLGGAITGADETVDLQTLAGLPIAQVTITQAGSAAGDRDTDTTLTNASVTAGDVLKAITAGTSTGPAKVWFYVTIEKAIG